MIEAHIVEVMVVVEVRDVVPKNEPLKIKWSSKASEVEDEVIGEIYIWTWKQQERPMLQLSKI